MNRAQSQASPAGAIRRSRQASGGLRSRRSKTVALTAFLAVALAGAGTFSIGEITGNNIVEAAVTRAQNLADMLGQRSPGTRSEAQLTKTKHSRALARKLRPAIAPKVNMTELARVLDIPPPAPIPISVATPQELALAPPSLGEIILPPPPAGPPETTPPGNSPPGVVVPTSQSKPLVLVPSAVPEPGTWATMLLGFALIGWKLRRNPSGKLKTA